MGHDSFHTDSSDDVIISKDLDGIILSWNAAASRLFGYTAHEIVGQSILQLIPEDLKDEEKRIIDSIRGGRRVEHFETVRLAKDGRLLDVSVTVSPIKDEHGGVIGASKILRDISDRKRAEKKLSCKQKKLRRPGAWPRPSRTKLTILSKPL